MSLFWYTGRIKKEALTDNMDCDKKLKETSSQISTPISGWCSTMSENSKRHTSPTNTTHAPRP